MGKAVPKWAKLMFVLLLDWPIFSLAALLKSVMALLPECNLDISRSREKQSFEKHAAITPFISKNKSPFPLPCAREVKKAKMEKKSTIEPNSLKQW